jgi:hypothetical protein
MAGARSPGAAGGAADHEIDAGTLSRSASPPPGTVDRSPVPLTLDQQTLVVDVAQILLDIIGIVDPTPISDAASAAISAVRLDWTGAGVSLLGIIPYAGDVAKASKLPRWLATVERCIVQARRSRRFADAVMPLLTRAYSALDALPMASLPPHLRRTLGELQARLASVVGASGRASRALHLIDALRGRLNDPDMVLEIIELGVKRAGEAKQGVKVDDFLADLGKELANFEGKPTLRLTRKPEPAVRASDTFGEPLKGSDTNIELLKADDMGRYLVPGTDLSRASDRSTTAVSHDWNKMSAIELQEIPAGSIVLEGLVSAQAGLAGGGRQIAHLGQLAGDGRVLARAPRRIVDGVTRLPGGSVSGTH